MKKIIFLIAIFLLANFLVKGQNFPNPTFAYNNMNYTVFHTLSSVVISNSSNPQLGNPTGLYGRRKINYDKLLLDVANVIKNIITPSQRVAIQTERVVSIGLEVDSTGKINLVTHFNIRYNTCLQPADIYNIEVALKNITIQFIDGLPPEAGRLGSIGIHCSKFR